MRINGSAGCVLSVWSLLALLGYLAVHRVHPYYLIDSQFVVRQSGTVVGAIHRSDIASVSLSRRFSETNPIVVDNCLYLPDMDGTNVDYVSRYVDDPAALVTELRQRVLQV